MSRKSRKVEAVVIFPQDNYVMYSADGQTIVHKDKWLTCFITVAHQNRSCNILEQVQEMSKITLYASMREVMQNTWC